MSLQKQKPSSATSSTSRWTTTTRQKENPDLSTTSSSTTLIPNHKPTLTPSTPSTSTRKHKPSPTSSQQKKQHTSQRKKQPLVLVQDTTTNVPQASSPIGRQLFKPIQKAPVPNLKETFIPLPASSPLARPFPRYPRSKPKTTPNHVPLPFVMDDTIEYTPPIPSTYLDEPLFPVLANFETSSPPSPQHKQKTKNKLIQDMMCPPLHLDSIDPFLVHPDPDATKFELDFGFVHDLTTINEDPSSETNLEEPGSCHSEKDTNKEEKKQKGGFVGKERQTEIETEEKEQGHEEGREEE